MKKFNKKTILDYISGNDIEGFDIDELENNPEFMAEVVCIDKKSYNLCSDEIKTDYNFVKKVMSHYINDYEFAKSIGNLFLNNVDNIIPTSEEEEQILEDQELAINILLVKSLKNMPEDEEGLIFRMQVFLFDKKAEIDRESFIGSLDEKQKDIIGYGFYIYTNRYGYNDIIMDHLAKLYLDQILTMEMNLEEKLHDRYHSYSEIERIGAKKIIIDMVSNYDTFLADYIGKNPESLEEINNMLISIKNRWVSYENHLNDYDYSEDEESDKYYQILEEVREMYILFTGAKVRLNEEGEIEMEANDEEIPFRKYIVYFAKKYKIERQMYDCLNDFYSIEYERMIKSSLYYNEDDDEENLFELYDDVFDIREKITFDDEYEEAAKLINQKTTNIENARFIKEIDKVFDRVLNNKKKKDNKKNSKKILEFKPSKDDE